MKVLHISYATTWGGGEQQMIDLIEALNVIGVKNPLICIRNSMLHEYAEKNKLLFFLIEKRGDLKEIKKVIDKSVDVIHIHTGSFIKDFIKLKIFNNITQPCVYTINGIMRKKSFLSKIKYNYSGINAIHFVSEAAKVNFKKNVAYKSSNKNLEVIYDGINSSENKKDFKLLEANKNVDANDFLVVNIANHTGAKNLKLFIEVADELINKKGQANIKFFQIGRETNLTEELANEIKNRKLSNHVHFLGFLDNAEEYFSSFNALLITSNREGLPLTIMEAFKYKVPVISTAAGGIPECIANEKNGFLSDLNDVEGLANHILNLKDNYKELYNVITNKAYNDYLEKYTSNKMAVNTSKLYKGLICEK